MPKQRKDISIRSKDYSEKVDTIIITKPMIDAPHPYSTIQQV